MSDIARGLDRSPSSVTRKVAANGGAAHYRIWPAHVRVSARQTTQPAKLDEPVLCAQVATLGEFWSPKETEATGEMLSAVLISDSKGSSNIK